VTAPAAAGFPPPEQPGRRACCPQARRIPLSECVALCLPSPGAVVTWFVTLLGIVFSAIAPDRIGRTMRAAGKLPRA